MYFCITTSCDERVKKCNGCGITVDDHFRVGETCPACHKKWESERIVRPYSVKTNILSRNLFWFVILIIFLLGTLYSLKEDRRYEKIAAGYAKQWQQLDVDSLNRVADNILTYNVEIRRKLFYMTTNHYLKRLNRTDLETMIDLISFTSAIDSVYHSRWDVYNLGRPIYSYGLYLEIVKISNDHDAPPALRQAAIKAVRQIGKPKENYHL